MTNFPSPGPDRPERGLIWGIKDSFLRYVAGITDGVCELSDGAAPYSPGRFLFPTRGTDDTYAGVLSVTAYGGILGVTVAQPHIAHTSYGLRLAVRTLDSTRPVLHVAALEPAADTPPDTVEYRALLLGEAVSWLGDAYAAGTELDRVTLL